MKLLLCALVLSSASAYGENLPQKNLFPIPEEVSELVTWTHLCEHWIKAESDSSQELHQDKQNLIDTTPALSWARDNCGYEALESRVIPLQEKYKSDPIISYTLDNLIGIYKD